MLASLSRALWAARRGVVATLVFIAVAVQLLPIWHAPATKSDPTWTPRQLEVKSAFNSSWHAYRTYAWGSDEFHPVSKQGSQMGNGQGLGWIIVDALDTMMLMGMKKEVSEARDWISSNLTYDQDLDVNTFETTIRMLGGLLSAHHLSEQLPNMSSRQDRVYLDKAIDLADRLLNAFTSPSGIPFPRFNLRNGTAYLSTDDGGASSTAETATAQLELKYLSHLVSNSTYWRKAEKPMEVIASNDVEDGLAPIFIHPSTGKFQGIDVRLGARGDSYFEYLLKQFLQTGERIYLEMWDQALGGIEKHMVSSAGHANLRFVGELPAGIGGPIQPKMDHLACYLPGTIALGVTGGLTLAQARQHPAWSYIDEQQIDLAKELTKTCFAMYATTATGLAPESVFFQSTAYWTPFAPVNSTLIAPSSNSTSEWKEAIQVNTGGSYNIQRPETIETLFYMWRITEDPVYRHWGWQIFEAFQNHTRVPEGDGYSTLADVTEAPARLSDNMESFWLAETLKYFYLLFSPNDILPLTDIVFNTEAHPLPRITKPKWETGWTKQKDDSAQAPLGA